MARLSRWRGRRWRPSACVHLPPLGTRSEDQSTWCRPVSHVNESKFIFGAHEAAQKNRSRRRRAGFPQRCRSRASQLERRASLATPTLRMHESGSSFHWHIVPMMNCSHAETGLGLIHCGNGVFMPNRETLRYVLCVTRRYDALHAGRFCRLHSGPAMDRGLLAVVWWT